MEKAYRIFTGAPCIKSFPDSDQPTWQTLTTRENTSVIPPASLQQADSRLSLIYQNVIFNSEDESEEIRNFLEDDPSNSSFLEGPSSIGPSLAKNHGSFKSQECTFDADMSGENSTFFSEGSSIRRFPTFAFNPNSISSLSLLSGMLEQSYESARIALLLGILEVDGPSYVKSKAPPHTEMALLKIVAGSEDGSLCKIVAWRETAEIWSGDYQDRALRRGDIVLFENLVINSPKDKTRTSDDAIVQLTASPNQKSQAQICYRALPTSHEDSKLRPDLRLAYSVPAVRKVSDVVEWMERMAGIQPQS